jgi:adenylate cyclase class IV
VYNVEFKAELRDPALARAILAGLKAAPIVTLHQTDTYFRVTVGRLKKRECPGEPTEYILYDRPDRLQPKVSHFKIYSEAEARQRFGEASLPVRVVVRKVRDLFMLGNVRIHVDVVESLGNFMEFEAIVSPETPVERCSRAVAELREALAPALGEPVSVGYADLIESQNDHAWTDTPPA